MMLRIGRDVERGDIFVVVVDIVVDIVFLDVFIVEKRFVVFIEKNRPRR